MPVSWSFIAEFLELLVRSLHVLCQCHKTYQHYKAWDLPCLSLQQSFSSLMVVERYVQVKIIMMSCFPVMASAMRSRANCLIQP